MADNTELNSGSGGDTIRTEDRTTFKTPVSLIDVGGTSAESLIGDSGVTMPVGGLVAHDAAVSGNPVLQALEAKDFDGSALPNVVSAEGDSVRAAASLYGVQYVMCVNEDGSTVGSVNAVCTNAGTFAVQESGAALTALQLIDDAIYVDDVPFTAGSNKVMAAGFRYDDATPDTVTQGDVGYSRMSSRRELYVTLRDAAGNERGLNVDASGYATVNVNGTVTVGSHAVTNAGTFAVQAAQSGTWTVDLGATDNAVLDAIAASLAGTLTVGSHAVTNAGTFAVQVDSALPAGTNNIGDVDVLSIAAGTNAIGDVGLVPRATGGCSVHRTIDLDESEEEVKATAGQLYGYYFFNAAASTRYIKFYNATAANVTVGTTTPFMTLPIPTGAAGHVDYPVAIAFDTAICIAATTGLADNDTGAPSANDVILNVFYK